MYFASPVDSAGSLHLPKQKMQPISFGGCFGWLHIDPERVGTTAVVLCPGLKTDELTGYRSLRQLADSFAKAGFPTLRFHYPGTGDSSERGVAEHWDAWQLSAHMAADWLREHCGAQRVVMGGLRFGAMLAAVVAEARADVAGLVLLAPVLRGKSYIRQLEIEAKLQQATGVGALAIGSLQLSDETAQLISNVDLRDVSVRANCPVVVYAQTPSPVLSQCVQNWRTCGARVTLEDFEGLEAMMRLNFLIHEPSAAVDRVAAWLTAAVKPNDFAIERRLDLPKIADIRSPGCIETPVRFGAGGALFAILCRPSASAELDLAVIICNTGGDPHCAPVNVDLARRLAAQGIASLRIDFAGLGDSVAPGDSETHVLETNRRSDLVAAIDLIGAMGYRRVAVQGLCSGAYHAFHAAIVDPRVDAVILVNLPQFEWTAGAAIEVQALARQSPLEILRKIANIHAWRVLPRERLNLRGRLIGLNVWLTRHVSGLAQRYMRLLGFGEHGKWVTENVAGLAQRAPILFLFSEGDVGIEALAQALPDAQVPPGVTVRVVPDLDHSITGPAMRRVVADQVISFLLDARQKIPVSP
jgi:pimeloyl-ACP methyl ester carboxylesterase